MSVYGLSLIHIYWGEEGVDYEVVDAENNIINYPDGKDDSNTYHLAEGWQLFDQFKMHIWEGDSPDIWDETKALNESAIKSKAFGFTYDSTSVANELAAPVSYTHLFIMHCV